MTSRESHHAIKKAVESPATLAFVLCAIANKAFGHEWLGWDPATIWMELRDEFSAEPCSEATDRLAALQVVLSGADFFTRPEAFSAVCNTFSSGAPSFTILDPPGAEEAAWAVTEVALVRDFLPLGYHVRNYVEALLADAGLDDDPPAALIDALARDPGAAIQKDAVAALRDQSKTAVEEYVDAQLRMGMAQLSELPGFEDVLPGLLRERDLERLGSLEVP